FSPAHGRDVTRQFGIELRQVFDGLPMRIAFTGTQAILAYYSRVPVAIEATTGLTDSAIAHQPLLKRGRVGHEKNASFPYLLKTRKVQILFSASKETWDSLAAYIPVGEIDFGEARMTLMRWDRPVLETLKRRGAKFDDFEVGLDQYLSIIGTLPDSLVRQDYGRS